MIISTGLAFELLAPLGAGEGRNSEVFRAFDRQLNAEIVVKRIAKAGFLNPDEYFGEARKLYEARHPNVVDVRYACEDADHIYLAMPLYPGGSLQRLRKAVPMTVRQIIGFGLDFLQGLHHVHTQGLVHFDIKPSNILLDVSGKAALADFGIAKHLRVDGLASVDKLYFLHWPPEYMAAPDLSQAADIYQAGLTLYRLIVGVDSLEKQSQALSSDQIEESIRRGALPNRTAFPLHVPRQLSDVVKTALALDPATRFPSVLDMMAALAAVNTSLDWIYTASPDGSRQAWEIGERDQIPKVVLEKTPSAWNVTTTKTNAETGVARNQARHSYVGKGWGGARSMVIRALRELE